MGKADTAILDRPDGATGPTDHELVRRVRLGDDRAFEALYARYQRRIAGYVFGMVKDYGRAEDITQEVFVSALRRMRQTERPIAFKPWIYEIAKNACIDAYRRGRRTEEVSFDADDRLSPADCGRLVATGPSPDAAVDTKQDLDHLCGAFGGLSDVHHQILVMRELEGMSYKDIGERLGMSRPAVESTLFRARKRLGEEYDELASGARCLRVQAIIADAEGARVGLRDQRKLARHISHCQPCRRLAVHAGLDVPVPARTRIAEKIAGLLPLPAFLRLRRGGEEATAASGGGGNRWAAHVPMFADQLQSGWGKAVAGVAAVLVAGAGAGVTTSLSDKRDERGTGYRPAAERSAAPAGGGIARAPEAPAAGGDRRAVATERGGRTTAGRKRVADRSRPASAGLGRRAEAPASGPGAAAPGDAPRDDAPDRPAGGGGGGSGDGGGRSAPADKSPVQLPAADVPEVPVPAGAGAGDKLKETVDTVDETVQNAGQDVGTTVDNALGNVQRTLEDPQNVVPGVGGTVDQAVKDAGTTTGGVVDGLGKTVGGLLKP
jgi:RNA polymerase sigma factor (sigma-70 family)